MKWGVLSGSCVFLLGFAAIATGYFVKPSPNLEVTPQTVLEPHTGAFDARIQTALKAHQFGDLEKQADDYRRSEARFIGGRWKLPYFYRAVALYSSSSTAKDTKFEAILALLKQWQAAEPQSVTPKIALGWLWIEKAWEKRGNQYGYLLKPEQIEGMYESLNEANYYLRDVPPISDPFGLKAMREAAMMIGAKSEVFRLYGIGTKYFPRYYEIYGNQAHVLQPNWFGSAIILRAYNNAIMVRQGGIDELIAYAFITDQMYWNYTAKTAVIGGGLDWSRIKESYAALAKLYGLRDRDWNVLLSLSVFNKDCETAEEAIAHIGQHWDPDIWQTQDYYNKMVSWVRANENKQSAGAARKKAEDFIALAQSKLPH